MKEFTIRETFFLIIIFFFAGTVASAQSTVKLKSLGQVVVPFNYSFHDTPVGGLSGLTYDQNTHQFYVISDDRSDNAPARFYTFSVDLHDGKLTDKSITWESVQKLKTPQGNTYPKGKIDPEGIAIGSDNFVYVSSEGVPSKNVAPFINGYSTDGRFARAFTIPEAYWSKQKNHRKWGVRSNLGFEGLSVTPDASALYSATENALHQDGAAADSVYGSPSRIIMYDLPSGNIVHEFQYNVAPIYITPKRKKGFAVNGLSDLLALGDGRLLTLERNFVLGQGNRICLYEVSTKGATDIKGVDNLGNYRKKVQPVQKKLVANLSDYNIDIDNFEGLALGPKLPGGGKLLLMISDNNFSPLQETIFTAFSFREK